MELQAHLLWRCWQTTCSCAWSLFTCWIMNSLEHLPLDRPSWIRNPVYFLFLLRNEEASRFLFAQLYAGDTNETWKGNNHISRYLNPAANASVVASHRTILQPHVICHQRSLLHLSPWRTAVHNQPWLKGDCSCRGKSASHYKILHTSPSSVPDIFLKSNIAICTKKFFSPHLLPMWSFANSHPLASSSLSHN